MGEGCECAEGDGIRGRSKSVWLGVCVGVTMAHGIRPLAQVTPSKSHQKYQ